METFRVEVKKSMLCTGIALRGRNGAGIGILGTILFAVVAVMGMMFLVWFIGLAGSGLR